ncbi:hypothetical protein [Pontibacter cellulosilyticus]|uniref:Uncharacterized protein n=1 Tax=Pontibacter cellulosilyticus TaxID=1720253 RepID=A0A923N4T5_9BACT|nr:hypothetical protein [Pontibacter cellulosilyticus]MBC5991486.1 hypothetical protein [Pontibacter cellulosilyticus]
MLSRLKEVERKLLIASIVPGVCLASLFLFKNVIFNILYEFTGIAITAISSGLSLFIPYLLTAPAAIVFSSLLCRHRLTYDKALTAGMISNYAFCLYIILFITSVDRTSIPLFGLVGIIFFATLFGFILGALTAVLNDKIEPGRIKIKF